MPGMRAEFRRRVPTVPVLPGSAEAIPLPDGIADAVVAAQAAHWFQGRAAVREIARVLRPGGGLGLVWNTRFDRAGWPREFARIVESRGGPRPAHSWDWRATFRSRTGPFYPQRRRTFRFAPRAPVATFPAWATSVSRIQLLPLAERRRVAREVRTLLATHPQTRGRRTVTLPYRTEVYTTRLRRTPRR
jgi:SAM-dependent methyltransferase